MFWNVVVWQLCTMTTWVCFNGVPVVFCLLYTLKKSQNVSLKFFQWDRSVFPYRTALLHLDILKWHHCWYRKLCSDVTLKISGTSLVAQWLRIHLPMQGTRVRSLVWEDPTCHGATKPMSYLKKKKKEKYQNRRATLRQPKCSDLYFCCYSVRWL